MPAVRPEPEQRRPGGASGPVPVVEATIVGIGVVLFTRLHAVLGHDVAAATANARDVQSVERVLHLTVEVEANQWFVGHPALAVLAVWVYRLYYAVLVGVLAWVWLRHRENFVRVRRTLLTMAAIALLVYWAVPLSPPRFALPGIVDVVARHDIFGGQSSQGVRVGANVYSAMPSMHVGWALWCSYAVWFVLRSARPRLAWAAWIFPAVMTCVVIGTGNHYLLDVVGSVLLLAVSVLVTSVWDRRFR